MTYPGTPSEVDAAGMPRSLVDRLLTIGSNVFGLDRAIVFTILARGWSSVAGIGTLTLVARFLTPAEQGYYYTFYSLVALQIVFELGFSTVILQTAGHEAAHLAIDPDGRITGPKDAHARLASVLQKSVRWYSVAAVLMGAIVLPAGIWFFSGQPASLPLLPGQMARGMGQPVSWVLPWILVILATMGTFQIDPVFSFMEGCGLVARVARVRLTQTILGTILGWGALLLHHGLFAPGLMIFGQAVAGGCYLYGKRQLLIPLLKYDPNPHRINWGSEIWPFQWRIAVSWLCGYMIFQTFNPILFHYRGPIEAGRMGMSTAICGTLSGLAVAWMNTKASPFGQMIARGEYERLDKIFFRALIQSTSAATLACSAVLIVVIFLRAHNVPFALRLLSPVPLAMLLGATIINVIVFAEALYIRAHKQEKFLLNALLGALWMVPAAFFFGRRYGASGVAASYLAATVVIGLGHGTITFRKWRRIWHQS